MHKHTEHIIKRERENIYIYAHTVYRNQNAYRIFSVTQCTIPGPRYISAAPFATSVPWMPMATPMSAWFKAGASLTSAHNYANILNCPKLLAGQAGQAKHTKCGHELLECNIVCVCILYIYGYIYIYIERER